MNLPDLWRIERIKNLCEPIKSEDAKLRNTDSFRYVDISSIDNDQKTIQKAIQVSKNEAPSRARQVIAENDVLVSTVRPELNAVAIVPHELDGEVCSTGFCVLRPRQNILDSEYLFAWTRHSSFIQMLARAQRGIGYPAVRDDDVKAIEIPLPPLPEQHRIVEILRLADELRSLRRQSDEKAKQLLPALFEEMFGKPAPNWRKCNLGELIYTLQPGKSVNAKPHPAREGQKGVLKVSAVTTGEFIPDENKELFDNVTLSPNSEVKKGDLLISRANTEELVGASAIVRDTPQGLFVPDKLWRVVLRKEAQITIPFLYTLLNTPKLRDEISRVASGTSGSMKNISQERFLGIRVELPPLEIQKRFTGSLELFWEYILNNQEKRKLILDELFESLLVKAFTGELTTQWREDHQEELASAAEERDRLLQLSFSRSASGEKAVFIKGEAVDFIPTEYITQVIEDVFFEEGLSFDSLKTFFSSTLANEQPQAALLEAFNNTVFTAEDFDVENNSAQRLLEAMAGTSSLLSATTLTEDIEEEIPHFVAAFRLLSTDDEARTDFSSTE